MNRKDVEKFLSVVKDQAFGIWLRHNNNEESTYNIEVCGEVELLEEALIVAEKTEGEDGKEDVYWAIINLDDIVEMNCNY